jgi:hypothetical protein
MTNQAEFDEKLGEVMLTKKGALQVLELLAKLNRQIGARGRGPCGEDRDRRQHPLGGREGRDTDRTAGTDGLGRSRRPVS